MLLGSQSLAASLQHQLLWADALRTLSCNIGDFKSAAHLRNKTPAVYAPPKAVQVNPILVVRK